jgi:hypothetical protein
MSWLKRIGTVLVKASQVIVGLQPFMPAGAVGIIATVEDVIAQALGVIVQVEAMGQALALSGPQKLQAAVAQGTQIFLVWSQKLGKKIGDQAKFTAGVTKVFDGLVDIANSWKDETIKTEDVQ